MNNETRNNGTERFKVVMLADWLMPWSTPGPSERREVFVRALNTEQAKEVARAEAPNGFGRMAWAERAPEDGAEPYVPADRLNIEDEADEAIRAVATGRPLTGFEDSALDRAHEVASKGGSMIVARALSRELSARGIGR